MTAGLRSASEMLRPRVGEIRFDAIGQRKVMAVTERYVMVRRPGAAPHVLNFGEWYALAPSLAEGA